MTTSLFVNTQEFDPKKVDVNKQTKAKQNKINTIIELKKMASQVSQEIQLLVNSVKSLCHQRDGGNLLLFKEFRSDFALLKDFYTCFNDSEVIDGWHQESGPR